MNQILQITSDPLQKQTIVLPDGSSFQFQMYFSSLQYGWTFTSITYKSFVLNGFRICNSPNMLQQYRNSIPFGIACLSTNNREPQLIQDFSSGNSSLYVLSAAEVAAYQLYLEGLGSG